LKRESRSNSLRVFLLAWAWCTLATSLVLPAQDTSPLSVEDALKVRSFGPLMPVSFSSNGKWLAYVIQNNERVRSVDEDTWARTGVRGWNTGTDVCVFNIQNGETRNLTQEKGGNWLPVWSPDSEYLAFLSTRDGSGQARLWLWDTAKDELRRVSDLEVRAEEIAWTQDSKGIFITTLPEGLSIDEYARKRTANSAGQNAVPAKSPGSTVLLYQTVSTAAGKKEMPESDAWNLNWALRDLRLVDVASSQSRVIVRSRKIVKFLASPDGLRIAYTNQKRFEHPGSQQILFDLATINLSTLQERVVASDIRLYFPGEFSWSPDSSQLSYLTGGIEELVNDDYVVSADGGNPRNITKLPRQEHHFRYMSVKPLWDAKGEFNYFIYNGALWRASVKLGVATEFTRVMDRQIVAMIAQSQNIFWTPDGGRTSVVLTHGDSGKEDGFYKIDLSTGRNTKLLEEGHCHTCAIVSTSDQLAASSSDGQRLAYFEEDTTKPPDLWMTDTSFRARRQVTRLNPRLNESKMGAARLIDWLSDDGERLHGALLLPADYQKGMRYPLIVYVYGGFPISDRFHRFGLEGSGPFNMQLLATRGYAVLLPDAPQHLGTPMLDLAKTVLPGVNKVVEMGIADPERLGVMGHSYGGYSTMSLLVQTKRFRAAIEADGAADLIGEYGAMDGAGNAFGISALEGGQGLMGGTPWQERERYIENSPIFYLDRLETPLLIVHGAEDTTVASFLGDELFVGLRRLGKEVQYAKYIGEGHSPLAWGYGNQVDLSNRMIAWMDRYLKAADRPRSF
jgi:dipeptidyl aminopeptidase/acylaminoacyl peptidase